MSTIYDRIVKGVADQAGLEPGDIKPESRFFEDLKFDSLDFVETIIFIEEEFEIGIDDSEVEGITTVQAAVDAVTKRIGKGA